MNRDQLAKTRRVVIKVGSSLVTHHGTALNADFLVSLAQQLSALRSAGRQIVLVTSGAIAAGMARLSWAVRPRELHRLQAAAAVGQVVLAQAYENVFSPHQWPTAQILLTHEDLRDRTRYLNARSTLQTLLELDILPIINENDTVVSDEIRFGDNDTLAALVTNLMEAELLILLTDQAGLFDANPREHPQAQLITFGRAEDQTWEKVAGEAGSAIARGGMYTKVRAARRAARSGAHTLIAAGHEPQVLPRLLAGENLGTLLCASLPPLAARKQWLADHLKLAGSLILDEGAVRALGQGRSLLPVGIQKVVGAFQRGAPVQCMDQAGREVARGLVNYSATEVGLLAGHPSQDIERLLGYVGEAEVIHRNNLVMN